MSKQVIDYRKCYKKKKKDWLNIFKITQKHAEHVGGNSHSINVNWHKSKRILIVAGQSSGLSFVYASLYACHWIAV